MKIDFDSIYTGLGSLLTMQYDYPPTGEGWIGYKGHNMYRFKVSDTPEIEELLYNNAEKYRKSFNASSLAQEIISDLLDEELIEYGGYGYKSSRNGFSI